MDKKKNPFAIDEKAKFKQKPEFKAPEFKAPEFKAPELKVTSLDKDLNVGVVPDGISEVEQLSLNLEKEAVRVYFLLSWLTALRVHLREKLSGSTPSAQLFNAGPIDTPSVGYSLLGDAAHIRTGHDLIDEELNHLSKLIRFAPKLLN